MVSHLKKWFRTHLITLQRYTKTDMVYLARNGFWTILSYVIQVGTGILTTVALANLLPKESLGTYQFILSVAGILSVFTLSGLGAAVTRAVAQGKEGVLRSGVRTKLKWSIGIVLASGAVSLYYLVAGNETLAIAFLFIGAFAPFIESFKLYENYLHGKEAFRDSVLLGAWRKPLPVFALITAAWFTSDVLTLVFVYFISNAISYIAVYIRVIQKYKPSHTHDVETFSLSRHLSIFRIVGQIGRHIDKILIWHFLGAAAVASFTIAQFATRYSGGLISTLSALVLPKVSKRDLSTLQHTLPRKVRLFTLLMLGGAGIYILAAPFIFPVLFPDYPESILLSQVLAVTFLFMPRTIYGQTLVAHKQVKAQYIISISSASAKIILLYVLLPIYGMWGAVYAILATELLGSMLVKHLFMRA